jgi:NitT/TauT family transport system substrate-binding protein
MLRKCRLILRGTLIGAAAMIAVAACGTSAGNTATSSAGGLVTVRAGWVPTVHSTHWATTQQFIKDKNVKIQLMPFKTNNEMFVAMQSGSLDMMTMGYNNTVTALARGAVNYKYVAGVSVGGSRLLVRNGVKVDSWSDLRGKRIGSSRGSTQYQQLVLAMTAHGLNIDKDVAFTNISGAPDMVLALSRGDVDAVSIWEPSASEAVQKGFAHEVPAISGSFYDDSFRLNSGLVARDDFVTQHSTAVQAVIDGYYSAWQKVTGDQKWWLSEFSKLTTSTPAALDLAVQNVQPVVKLDRQQITQVTKRLADAKLVDKDETAEMGKLLDYQFLEKASSKSAKDLGDG